MRTKLLFGWLYVAVCFAGAASASERFETVNEYAETTRGVVSSLDEENKSSDLDKGYFLGLAHYFGLIVPEDREKAFLLFMQCADRGSARCMTNAAAMQADGVGTAKNELKAFELMSMASNAGYDDARENLAIFIANGIGTKKDVEKSQAILRELAEKGRSSSIYYLALSLIDEENSGSTEEATEILGKIANEENDAAMNLLAELLVSRLGGSEDIEKAAGLFGAAVRLGNRKAIYNLAKLKLMQKAEGAEGADLVDLLLVASAYGYDDAKYLLATQPRIAVSDTSFVKPHLLMAAADNGINPARVNLAISILSGREDAFDETSAINLLLSASREGFAAADYNLALWWLNSFDDSLATKIARVYLERAAELGYQRAKDKLSEIEHEAQSE